MFKHTQTIRRQTAEELFECDDDDDDDELFLWYG